MKHLILSCFFFLLCLNLAEAQTNANIPGPENVLVVYNSNSGVSDSVKNYYRDARNIPGINIFPVTLDTLVDIDDPETQTTHQVGLRQQGEIIMDITNEFNCLATPHAWIYFNDRIAKPIANYLKTTIVNGDTLKNTIRFIVLCKGIPHRIQSRDEAWYFFGQRQNVPVDGLLCLLGETIQNEERF